MSKTLDAGAKFHGFHVVIMLPVVHFPECLLCAGQSAMQFPSTNHLPLPPYTSGLGPGAGRPF